MAAKSKKTNPFYPVLVLVGLAFAITACIFAVMMVRGINDPGEAPPAAGEALIRFFQEHGFTVLMIELAVLALATVGAIATDELWGDRGDEQTAATQTVTPTAGSENTPNPPPEAD